MKTRVIVVIAAAAFAAASVTCAGREPLGPRTGSQSQRSTMQGSELQGSNLQGTETMGTVAGQQATGLRLESVHVVGGQLVPEAR